MHEEVKVILSHITESCFLWFTFGALSQLGAAYLKKSYDSESKLGVWIPASLSACCIFIPQLDPEKSLSHKEIMS